MFAPKERPNETQVRAEMITLAYDHLSLSSLAVVANAFVLSMALWSVIDHTEVSLWFISIFGVSLFRYYSALRFRHSREEYPIKYWEKLFLAGVTVSALIWASASLLLFAPESVMHQTMLIIVLAGMSAGAVSSLASVLTAIRIFLILMLVPLLIRLLLQDTELHYWIALLIVLFLALVLTISKRFNENNLKVIKSHLMYEKAKEELDLTPNVSRPFFVKRLPGSSSTIAV